MAIPGDTDILLVTTKACTFGDSATEYLSPERLKAPREGLSYKRANLGYGSTRLLFDNISAYRKKIDKKIANGEDTQNFINIWCPPCCHMIKTAEIFVSQLTPEGQERKALIYIDPIIPTSCCRNTTLSDKLRVIQQAIDDPNATAEFCGFDARPSFNYTHIEQWIEKLETTRETQSSYADVQSNFLEKIEHTTNIYAQLCGYSVSVVLAEADDATEASRDSRRIVPFARSFKPNEYFTVNGEVDMTWNPNAGLGGGFETKHNFRFGGTWS